MQFLQTFFRDEFVHINSLHILIIAMIGLIVGSFINVVIYRTPLIMMREWRKESVQFLESQQDVPAALLQPIKTIVSSDQKLSYSYPASHCPKCHSPVQWKHKIPLISWLTLKGRCFRCHQNIGARYPFIEVLTATVSILIVIKMGVQFATLFALIFAWTLIALAGIDFDSKYLPDKFTFPLASMGLTVNTQHLFVSPSQSIWGLVLGYLSLWIMVQLFYVFTKKQGMGQGDFKLLAAMGAWLGPVMLPFIILISSLLGSIIGLLLLFQHKESRPFAFGPFLAIAGIIALLIGEPLVQWYVLP